MSAPLVSIVIASHNYGRFLAEAITSALEQTHQPVEVLVVDDGSTDDSLEVAHRFPVKVLARQNEGVSAARNAGAAATTGEYLMFLDADDILECDYVAKCLVALQSAKAPVAYAYTQMRMFGAEEGIHASRPFTPRDLVKYSFVNASALMKRSAFEDAGGFDIHWRLGHEDYEFWIRMLAKGHHGVLVPEPLLRYRRHTTSRNTLSKRQRKQLKWALFLKHPRLFRWRIMRHPFDALIWGWRLRARS